jgi:hypothetical protein
MKKFIILAIYATSNIALSADLCRAKALRDVAALESPDSILESGEYDGAITQYRINKLTGMGSFCSHGGYCYPTHVNVKGKKKEALRLVNCKVGKLYDSDEEENYYSVDVDRPKNKKSELRKDDLENRFLDMGLCSACADNVAEFYIKNPKSSCAELAKQALEGNPDATKKLVAFPDYCQYNY